MKLIDSPGIKVGRLFNPQTLVGQKLPCHRRPRILAGLVASALFSVLAQRPGLSIGGIPPVWVREDAGVVRIEITRTTNDVLQTVEFLTVEGWMGTTEKAAREGIDYVATRGSLRFDPGQSSKFVEVPILDNPRLDGSRCFEVVLTNATPVLQTPSPDYRVMIDDNEVSPIVDSTFYAELSAGPDSFRGRYFLGTSEDGRVMVRPDARLNADGSIDFSFKPPLWGSIAAGCVFPSGESLMIGPSNSRQITRLGPNGQVLWTRTSLEPRYILAGPRESAYVLGAAPDGRTAVLQRWDRNGLPDTTFQASSFSSVRDTPPVVVSTPAGQVVLAGPGLDHVNGQPTSFLVRLNSDGSLDTTFKARFKLGSISAIVPLPDGKLLVSGDFDFGSDHSRFRSGLFRLNTDGSVDETLESALEGTPLLVRGEVWLLGKTLARLNNDGTIASEIPFSLHRYFWGLQGSTADNVTVTSNDEILIAAGLRDQPGISSFPTNREGPALNLIRLKPDAAPRDFRLVQTNAFYRPASIVTVQVVRSGDTSLPASVSFATRDGTARAGQHYEPQAGLLVFAPLEVAKPVQLLLRPGEDAVPRYFSLQLDQPSSGYVASPAAVVRIAPAPWIVPESVRFDFDPVEKKPSTSFALKYALFDGTYTVEATNDLRQWRTFFVANALRDPFLCGHYTDSPTEFFRVTGP